MKPDLLQLREAIEASWDEQTAYRGVKEDGNPALGNCYPTSRVVQHYFPELEIIKGEVWNGSKERGHFWNGIEVHGTWYYIDFSWQQFPAGSIVSSYEVLDQNNLDDSHDAIRRYNLLLARVKKVIDKPKG